MARSVNFSYAYKEECYAVWYAQGKPASSRLHDLLQPNEDGDVPAPMTLTKWKQESAWDSRAEQTDMEISKRTDRELIKLRMDMMKRHAERAQAVQDKAYEHLVEIRFDSSASAVTALFKAFDEEKKSRGMEMGLTKVFEMDDIELNKTMNRLLSKVSGVTSDEDSVDGEVLDAISEAETTDE